MGGGGGWGGGGSFAPRGGSFQPGFGAPQGSIGRSFNTPGNVGHGGFEGNFEHNFAGSHHGGEWWHNNNNFDHNHWYGRYGYGYGDIWPYYWFPWYAYGYGYYPYYYNDYYDYGYPDSYAYAEGASPYISSYAPPADETAATPTPERGDESTLGHQYVTSAQSDFRQGNYREALRLAGHAAVEMPRDDGVHNLLMLSMFAEGDYRGAAMEAHAAASLGKPMDWNTLYGFYGTVQPYTDQVRALEKFVSEHPADPAARFLLGYQYLMMGHNDAAKGELTTALTATPKDRLAATLLVQVGGTIPASVEAVQKQMQQDAVKAGVTPRPPMPGSDTAPVTPTPPSGPPKG